MEEKIYAFVSADNVQNEAQSTKKKKTNKKIQQKQNTGNKQSCEQAKAIIIQ